MSSDDATPTDRSDAKPAWPHAPVHRLTENGIYFVTVGTYLKQHHFRGPERLGVLHRGLLAVCAESGWRLGAWAVFSNHYHFVAESPGSAQSLPVMLGRLHQQTAKWVNRLEKRPGRKVWHNYRETLLTFERSYLARLRYTHGNPVKHGLVNRAEDYPWCSAGWFEQNASKAMIETINRLKTDQVKVPDDYEVHPEW